MDTATVVAVTVSLAAALFVVIICIVSAVSTVTGIRQGQDEDSEA